MSPMQCQDMEKFIHVYLDREFAEADRADFEQHLAGCERCRQLARFERHFKQQLKTGLARPHLPMDERELLRARIMQTLEAAPPLPAQRSLAGWAIRLVPAVAAAALLMALLIRVDRPQPAAVVQSVSGGQLDLPLEVRSQDPHAVKEWYRDKLPFRITPPRFRSSGTSLVGGRIDRVNAKRAAHLIYRRGDRRISVVLFPPEAKALRGMKRRRMGGRTVYYARQGEQRAATFRHRGVGYTIRGDLAPGELETLVRDVLFHPAESPAVNAIPVSSPGGP